MVLANVIFLCLQQFFRALFFFMFSCFFLQITNVHKDAYMHTYACYSNDIGFRKILVTEELPEWRDCVSRVPSVFKLLFGLLTVQLKTWLG